MRRKKFVKKSCCQFVILILSMVLTATCFSACSGSESNSDVPEVNKFMKYIKDGEYTKAIDYYNDELYGNYSFESEANNEIVKLLNSLNEDILQGKKDEDESKKTMVVIDNVLSKTNLTVSDYDKIKESIELSIASRAAFLAGKELESLKNYSDAVSEYKKVIETDSNYNEAKTAIERCSITLKQEIFDKAASLAEKNEYIEAIAQLKALKEKLLEDDEVIAKLSVYEKTYISNITNSAEQAFINPAEDYQKALDIINGALQHYSGNEDLSTKKAYYESFAPVYLYDMEKLKGEADAYDTDKDIYNNSYEKCFWTGYSSMIWNETDISYNLDKSYNTFSATVYSRSKKNEAQNMIVEIYADGKILYQKLNVSDNSTQPFKIELDVTGVSELRIVLTRNNGAIGAGIGMTDMIIQKTVK